MNSIEKKALLKERFGGVDIKEFDAQNNIPVEKTKLAIFDFDETLVHSQEVFRQVNIAAMKYLGLKYNDEIVRSIFSQYDKNYIGWGKNLKEQIEIYKNTFSPLVSKLSADPKYYRQMTLFNGMRDVIKELSKTDVALAIASSRDLLSIMRFLKEEDLNHHFSMIEVTEGGKIFPDKPNPSIANWIMGETGIDYNNSVMIGDSVSDIQLGKNACMKTIGIGYGKYTSPEKILAQKPDAILNKEEEISSLPQIISGLFAKSK